MQFQNTIRSFEVNSEIIEWDMRSAGINIIKTFQLLPQRTIDTLLTLPKKQMDIQIGKIGRDNKEFAIALEKKFDEVIETFMEVNDIDKDFDILSIKRDAVFVINKPIVKSEFGEYIKFIPKHTYSAYVTIGKYEFYFTREGEIDVKGLSGNKEERKDLIELHRNGILNLISEVVSLASSSNMDLKKMNEFMSEFVELYKAKELDFDYYREFNSESKFRYNMNGQIMLLDSINEFYLKKVDITHNYFKIILPLIRLTCLK